MDPWTQKCPKNLWDSGSWKHFEALIIGSRRFLTNETFGKGAKKNAEPLWQWVQPWVLKNFGAIWGRRIEWFRFLRDPTDQA